MKHISLFSGIGGFDLAAEWMGWENVAHCEWNAFGKLVLNDHWKNSKTHGDITKTDFTIYRGRVDIVTGGFPCQPYSVAGKRKGKDDDRHLWPEMLRAIREIQPRWIVGENVRGIINWNGGMVFDEVQADMEAQGYEILPFLLPAASVNAPHERYRTWFVAFNTNTNIGSARPSGKSNRSKGKRRYKDVQQDKWRESAKLNIICYDVSWYSSNTDSRRQPSEKHREKKPRRTTKEGFPNDWSNFPTQSPVCNGDDGFPAESLRQRIREDSMGAISEKEIDKILSKAATTWHNETIKAGGNAVVPPLVLQIFKAIQQYENL